VYLPFVQNTRCIPRSIVGIIKAGKAIAGLGKVEREEEDIEMIVKKSKLRLPLSLCAAICVMAVCLTSAMLGGAAFAQDQPQEQEAPPPPPEGSDQEQGPPPPANPEQPQPSQLSAQQLQQLVAPIALYPDALVAQILAASAYPTQIVEANRFLQQNSNLKGKDLADAVDQQDWDPSVKALTQFPSVLGNMDKDLSWTSELGDANYNQQADVMAAIQYMRHQAKDAGHLQSTPQQTVTAQGSDIDIQPANPDVVYVPEYNPELIYGYPVGLWPGFYPWWGAGGPFISFGVGFGISPFFGFGWGWPHWGYHWGYGGGLWFGGHPYAWHSHAFYDRNAYFHGGFRGPAPFARGDRGFRGYGGGARGERGFAPRAGGHPGAFGGIARGGDTRGFASRGRSSFGGGAHGGGGGFHGGGGHGGGGRH
jgi:uncharacterized membrane protein YgcG